MTSFMKRLSLFCILMCSIGIASCNKDVTQGIRNVSFSVEPYVELDDDSATRTSIVDGNRFVWAEGDTVGIYPNTGGQVYFAMTDGVGANTASFDGGGWEFKASALYYSYYPFIGDIYLNRNHIDVSYLGQKQSSTGDIVSHLGAYDFMCTPATSSSSGSLMFNYEHLNCIIRVTATLKPGVYWKMSISSQDVNFPIEGYYNLMSESPAIIPTRTAHTLSLALNSITVTEETSIKFYLMSAPVNVKNKELVIRFYTKEGTVYGQTKTPSKDYTAGSIGGLSCTALTEQQLPIDIEIDDWTDEN